MDFFIKGQGTVLGKRDDQRKSECDDHGDHIEPHDSFLRTDILKVNAASQIQDQKNQDRQQSFRVGLFLFHHIFLSYIT